MRKNYILLAALTASIGFFSFQHSSVAELGSFNGNIHKQSGGGQHGLTGAPGESTCAQCHQGNLMTGSAENSLSFLDLGSGQLVSEYVPGNSYVVTLNMTSNPTDKGFSATALESTATNTSPSVGTFTGDALGATQDFSNPGGTRDYVSHISSTGATAWSWNWTAPSTGVGDIIFYVATNEADGNGVTSNDIIHLSQHVMNEASNSINNLAFDYKFKAGYNSTNHEVVVDFNANSIDEMFVNLVDLNGRSVYTHRLGDSELGENNERVRLPEEIESGIYVVHFFVGNKAMSAKIMVQ